MCGIAGAVAAEAEPRVAEFTRTATRALAHRGPDGEGFWLDGRPHVTQAAEALDVAAAIALGHRRLSIVDLSGGGQPMGNEDATVWVTFNGEIYNQRELRAELERAGHRFATDCDTEVLVHGYEEWGEATFGRLNGIFALALVDVRERQVVLARDPVGVKPLYVGTSAGMTWWSSELQAALASGADPGEVSPDALKLFLTFRFIPSPHTIFERIWKVPPGHTCRLSPHLAGQSPRFRAYASSIRSTAAPRGQTEWREAVLGELERAVERQLMSDVPVATLLSGGVDSSLVTAMMAQQLPYPPRAFGIGFDVAGAANEAEAAQSAAACLGVPVETVLVDEDSYIAGWPAALRELGEPIANTGVLLVRHLCATVGRTHKVALSGQGADEPLGGYPRHVVERIAPWGQRSPRLTAALARRVLGAEESARLSRALAADDRIGRYAEIFSVLPCSLVDTLVPGTGRPARELAREAVGRWTSGEEPADGVNELLRIDARMSLSDDLLLIADHFSMRSSVELRVPFLDLALLELCERMPSRYKISPLGRRKWLYRDGALARLPAPLRRSLRTGPLARKLGFSTPSAWFDPEAGLAADRDALRASLSELPLSPHALDFEQAGPRQGALIYTLARWADQHARVLCT